MMVVVRGRYTKKGVLKEYQRLVNRRWVSITRAQLKRKERDGAVIHWNPAKR